MSSLSQVRLCFNRQIQFFQQHLMHIVINAIHKQMIVKHHPGWLCSQPFEQGYLL